MLSLFFSFFNDSKQFVVLKFTISLLQKFYENLKILEKDEINIEIPFLWEKIFIFNLLLDL
jgi:hypothetical protein